MSIHYMLFGRVCASPIINMIQKYVLIIAVHPHGQIYYCEKLVKLQAVIYIKVTKTDEHFATMGVV